MKISFAHCLGLATAGFVFLAATGNGALAQTAHDLKCNGCVGKTDLGAKSVAKKAIRRNAVASAAIRRGAVHAGKLAAGAKPSGADYTALDGDATNLTGSAQVIASVDVTAPAAGLVIVLAHSFLEFGAQELVGCTIATDTAFDEPSSVQKTGDSSIPDRISPLSTSRVFKVTKGVGTYNFVCLTDGGGAVQINNTKLTALFVPQQY